MKYSYAMPSGMVVNLNQAEYKDVFELYKKNETKVKEMADGEILNPKQLEQMTMRYTMQEYLAQKMVDKKKVNIRDD